MKIIQSFWTLPTTINADPSSLSNKFKGGWPSEAYHFLSWTLSCLKLREHYPEVNLITDSYGKEILIDQMKLPYTGVSTELDDIRNTNPKLWGYGKIHAYSLQAEPFIHVDSDVFIWNKFPKRIHQAKLLAQHLENYPFYRQLLEELSKQSRSLPSEFTQYKDASAINAGIIGGQDFAFYKGFRAKVETFINMYPALIEKQSTDLSILLEQFYSYEYAKTLGLNFEFLLPDVTADFKRCFRFNLVPHKEWFIHTIGFAKKSLIMCMQIQNILRHEYPQYYDRIKQALPLRNLDGTDEDGIYEWDISDHYFRNLKIWRNTASVDVFKLKFVLNDEVNIVGREDGSKVLHYVCSYELTEKILVLNDFDISIANFSSPMSSEEFAQSFSATADQSQREELMFRILNRLTECTFYLNILRIVPASH